MKSLPDSMVRAWENKKGPVTFTTVNKENTANSIYATCVSLYDSKTILIADNYLDKTKQNVLDTAKGVVLFITHEDKSFQVKGSLEYKKEGKFFDDMKKWNPEKHPGHGVVVLSVEEAYSGAEKLL